MLVAEFDEPVGEGTTKMICAGEMLQSGSGVLRSCIIVRRNLSVSRDPDGPVLDQRRRLIVLTATSAFLFSCR